MLILKQLSSLEKVFLNREITVSEYSSASVLQGEEFAYQIAYRVDTDWREFEVSLETEIPAEVEIFDIKNVPAEMAKYHEAEDEGYITGEPGLFPDVLDKLRDNTVRGVYANRAIWINVKQKENAPAGVYPITVTFENKEHGICESKTFKLEIIGAKLPEQKLIFTQWFHGDCIATYYKEEVFSESHWEHLESFIQMAADNGINMLLTPVFTPPLDTAIGGERPTIQLVDVTLTNGKYSFGFDRLKRWIELCKKCGIKYFEISHLFTQWGAKFTPKIMATVDGVEKRIFGWDVEATSSAYKEFMAAFLPELTAFLREENLVDNTYFHISDEPSPQHLENYVAAANIVKPYLEGFKIIDALSDYGIYKTGAVECPIPSTNEVEEFLEIENLWVYYCCGQINGVSNRFLSMPSYRNRILGTQMYKYDIAGFLQWGYNFYYAQFSKYPINPYAVTDSGYGFSAGDAFSVYPGDDGQCVASLRLKVFLHGLQDMRAFALLEEIIGKDEVVKMLDSECEIRFNKFPHSAEYIINLREKVNAIIKANI